MSRVVAMRYAWVGCGYLGEGWRNISAAATLSARVSLPEVSKSGCVLCASGRQPRRRKCTWNTLSIEMDEVCWGSETIQIATSVESRP